MSRGRRSRTAALGGSTVLAAAAAWAAVAAVPESAPIPVDIATGRLIYLTGTIRPGMPVRATVASDVAVEGVQAACANCHRRSGFGSQEGTTPVPPVVGDVLFQPLVRGARVEGRASGTAVERQAYTDLTLARALREGVNPAGRTLDAAMPRFPLEDAQMVSLIGYLKTLSSGTDPGVSESSVRLATIVAGDVDPAARDAFLAVMKTFVAERNAGTRREAERRRVAPRTGEPEHAAYRTLDLDVWELRGRPESWRAQLEAYYRQRPVFAIVSGLAAGPWQPIHEFSEANALPGLFPITDLPVTDGDGGRTIYFSRGLALEGEAIARRLLDRGDLAGGPIVQVFRAGGPGAATAAAFRRAIAAYGAKLPDDIQLDGRFAAEEWWRRLLLSRRPRVVAAWVDRRELAALAGALESHGSGALVVASSTLVAIQSALPDGLRGRLLLSWPLGLPEQSERLFARTRAWLRGRKIEVAGQARVQAGAFFAITMASDGLKDVIGHYVRDYYVERIEHMVDSAVVTGGYPRLTLGPDQRYAAKGCFVVRLDAGGTLTDEAGWLVP